MSERQPYPGLRSFTRDEADLFFGRDDSADEMIDILGEKHFLAVLGPSGSGKSSLVKTGLFEGVRLGFLHHPNPSCWIVETRPARSPLRQLAESLLRKQRNLTPQESLSEADIEALAERLDYGPRSLALWAAEGNVPPETSLLVLVDQFEELFRYSNYNQLEDAESFVGLLLESAASHLFPIYIVITMRSEFLGACSSINRLAERISESLYLTPRMERDACRAAIEGPTGVVSFRIEPALVNRMLNDLAMFIPRAEDKENDFANQLALQSDQLPLMQHALNQLWVRARERNPNDVELRTVDYEALGGMAGAINQHCDSLVEQIAREVPGGAALVQTIFRALVDGPSVATAVRRPRAFGHLVALAGDRREDVATVIRTFRDEASFLYTSRRELDDNTDVDISHESLIRQWKQLSLWLDAENLDGAQWQRLLDRAGRKEMPSGATLQNFVDWWSKTSPNAVWAARYGGKFGFVKNFLDESARVDREQRQRRRLTFGAVTAVIVGLALVAIYLGDRARRKGLEEQALAAQSRQKLDAELAELNGVETKLGIQKAALASTQEQALAMEENADLTAAPRTSVDPIHQLFWLSKAAAVQSEKEKLPPALASKDAGQDADMYRDLAEAEVNLAGQRPLYAASTLHKLNIEQALYASGTAVAITRDARQVAIWNSESGAVIKTIDGLGKINAVAASPDGQRLAVATETNGALVYSLPSGTLLAQLETGGFNNEVLDAEFSSDSRMLATGDQAGDVRVWRVAGFRQASPNPASSNVKPDLILQSPDRAKVIILKLAFAEGPGSPRIIADEINPSDNEDQRKSTARLWTIEGFRGFGDEVVVNPKASETNAKTVNGYLLSISCAANRWCALVGSRNTVLWNPYRDTEMQWPDSVRASHAVFSHDGTWLIASHGSDVTRFDTGTWQPMQLRAHSDDINSISLSDDDRYFTTSSDDGSSVVWNLATGVPVNRLNGHGKMQAAIFHPGSDDAVLTYSDDRTVTQWNLKQVSKPVERMPLGEAVARTVFSPDDSVAAVLTNDKGLLIDRGTQAQTPVVEGLHCRDVAFSNDNHYAAFSCGNSVTVWDRRRQRRVDFELRNKTMLRLAYSPDSRMLVTLSEEHKATVWNANTGQPIGAPMKLAGTHIYDASFDRSSTKLVLVGEAGTGAVFTLQNGDWVPTMENIQHRGTIYHAVFSRDGSRVITAGVDGYVRIWRTSTGEKLKELKCLSGVRNLELSPNGSYFVTSGDDGSVELWAEDGRKVAAFSGLTGRVDSTSFNASQTLLAAAGANGETRVWDIATRQLVAYIAERPAVNDLDFAHHSDRLLAVASSDERVSYWQVPPAKTLAQLDNIAKQFLPDQKTQALWNQELPTLGHSDSSARTELSAAKSNPEKH